MKWIKKIIEIINANIIIVYGEPKMGHSFSSYENYLEYKKQQ